MSRPDPITPAHAARILARAAVIDNRDPSATADTMWADALTEAGVHYWDCMQAVTVHYGRTTDRVMPAHIVTIAREIARDRASREQARAAIEATSDPTVLGPEELGRRLRTAYADAVARKEGTGSAQPFGEGDCTCTPPYWPQAMPDPWCPLHTGPPADDPGEATVTVLPDGHPLAVRMDAALDARIARDRQRPTRAEKIPHPSGDDGYDGMAWCPDE